MAALGRNPRCSTSASASITCLPARPNTPNSSSSAGNWTRIADPMVPNSDLGAAIVFDGHDGYALLVTDGTTWRETPAGWTELNSTLQPAARIFESLQYDPELGKVILFGGYTWFPSEAAANDTWEYSDGAWSQFNGTPAPPASQGAEAVFDTSAGYLLEFNGLTAPGTWKFNATGWSNITTSSGAGPSSRFGAFLADDPRDNGTLLFGGTGLGWLELAGQSFREFGDTWFFSGGTWRNLTGQLPAAPSARNSAVGAFDAADGYVLLDRGAAWGIPGQPLPTDAWTFAGGRWTEVPSNSSSGWPPEGYGGSMTFDPGRECLLVYFWSSANADPSTTWIVRALVWSPVRQSVEPPPIPTGIFAADLLAYDAHDGYVLLFGGGGLSSNETWTYTAGAWTELFPEVAPPAGSATSMAYDPADGYVVLVAGVAETVTTGQGSTIVHATETWTYSNGTWTNRTRSGAPAPSARVDAAFTYDSEDGYLLLFGGALEANLSSYGFTTYGENDTWSYRGGNWTERSATMKPPARFGASMADDPVGGFVLLYGGAYYSSTWTGTSTTYNDSWTYLAGKWTEISSPVAPSARYGSGIARDPTTGRLVLFGGEMWGYGTGGPYNDTWVFANGSWSEVQPAAAPPAVAFPLVASDVADRSILLYAGSNGYANASEEEWSYQGVPFDASLRSQVEWGTAPFTADLNGTVVGGAPPENVSWNFGDGGSRSANLTSRHTYEQPGTYFARLNVTDSNGNSAYAVEEVLVASNLTVNASAAPMEGVVPLLVALNGTGARGVSPYNFTWTFGDGSSPAYGAATDHRYSTAGVFRAVLTLTDANGSVARAGVEIDAAPVPMAATVGAEPVERSVGHPINFTSSVSGGVGGYTYAWSFGDGSGSALPDPAHAYAAPGAYLVSLDAFDADGDGVVAETEVWVVPALVTTGRASLSYQGDPLAVLLQGSATGGEAPYSAIWSFGDGSYGFGLNVTHTYPSSASYNVSLTVTDTLGDVASAGPWALALPAPVRPLLANLSVTPAPVFVGGVLVLQAAVAGGTGPYTFVWAGLPPGCIGADRLNLSCPPSRTGTFEVDFRVVDALGVSAHAVGTVVVVAAPLRIGVVAAPFSFELGGTTELTASANGGVAPVSVDWSRLPPGCSAPTGWTGSCRPSSVGNFTVAVEATDAENGTVFANATVVVAPVPAASPGPSSPVERAAADPWEPLFAGLAVGGIAGAVAVYVLTRRRERPPSA